MPKISELGLANRAADVFFDTAMYPLKNPRETARAIALGGLLVVVPLIAAQAGQAISEHGGLGTILRDRLGGQADDR